VRLLCLEAAVLGMMAQETVPQPVAPDAVSIAAYVEVVFGYCDGWVAVRALAEKGANDRPPHTPFVVADKELASKLAVQAGWANETGMALFVVPGTVAAPGEAKAEDIVQTQVVLVDLDHGDIAAKRDYLLRHLGAPTLEVASGGITPEGQRKLHLYWRLTEPAEGEEITKVCRLRHAIAVKVGGDPSFRSAHQPIRVAGSVHAKGGIRRAVEILKRTDIEFDLRDLAEAVMAMPPLEGEAISEFDFNDASAGKGAVPELFGRRIREGGVDGTTRFDALSRVIGYWIRRCREGHVTPAQAWDEIVAYNEARIDPPWPLDKLQHEAERLWKRDAERGGGAPGTPGDVPGDGGPDDEAPPPQFTEDAARTGGSWRPGGNGSSGPVLTGVMRPH
jgi:putative DNA primase/helicase